VPIGCLARKHTAKPKGRKISTTGEPETQGDELSERKSNLYALVGNESLNVERTERQRSKRYAFLGGKK